MARQVNSRDGKVEEHVRISRQFMRQAEEEFAKGDKLQASEKAWGAAAHAVKAVAQQRGWQHDGHRYLFEAIDRIYRETNDSQIRGLFSTANSLHMNFYENWQTDNSCKTVSSGRGTAGEAGAASSLIYRRLIQGRITSTRSRIASRQRALSEIAH